MSFAKQARELSTEALTHLLQQHGSIQAIVHHITGGKHMNMYASLYLSEFRS
jgi:hypothetical protein